MINYCILHGMDDISQSKTHFSTAEEQSFTIVWTTLLSLLWVANVSRSTTDDGKDTVSGKKY